MREPGAETDYLADHAALLLASYERLLGRSLVTADDPIERAKSLYEAPFVVCSHDTASDPIFNYANLAAQKLFELDWSTFVTLPSRLSAGPMHREERQRLLEAVTRKGYIDDYCGIRVASSGRQFHVRAAIVWNLIDAAGNYAGQAATFSEWTFV